MREAPSVDRHPERGLLSRGRKRSCRSTAGSGKIRAESAPAPRITQRTGARPSTPPGLVRALPADMRTTFWLIASHTLQEKHFRRGRRSSQEQQQQSSFHSCRFPCCLFFSFCSGAMHEVLVSLVALPCPCRLSLVFSGPFH